MNLPLNHIKFHFFVLLYLVALFGLNLSGDSDSGHLPGFSAVATSDVGGFSGERRAKFSQRYVRQFQRGLFRDQRAVDLYIDFDCVSFIVFNRYRDCALISLYLFVCWYSRGSSCFSAARPGVVCTILVRLFIGTVDQLPDRGAFGRKSVCSWPRLRANSGQTGGQDNQWRLR